MLQDRSVVRPHEPSLDEIPSKMSFSHGCSPVRCTFHNHIAPFLKTQSMIDTRMERYVIYWTISGPCFDATHGLKTTCLASVPGSRSSQGQGGIKTVAFWPDKQQTIRDKVSTDHEIQDSTWVIASFWTYIYIYCFLSSTPGFSARVVCLYPPFAFVIPFFIQLFYVVFLSCAS